MSQHILVVDDEADIEALFRQQFRRDLKAGRFRMEFATSAQQALRMIEGADGRDIVLLLSDVNMPGMSGLDLLPRAKAVRPDLAVIMVTAYGDLETRRRAVEGGAEGLLPKPIDFAALRAEVDRRLGQRRAGP
jgi:DNA-binding NtrC family response regulator